MSYNACNLTAEAISPPVQKGNRLWPQQGEPRVSRLPTYVAKATPMWSSGVDRL